MEDHVSPSSDYQFKQHPHIVLSFYSKVALQCKTCYCNIPLSKLKVYRIEDDVQAGFALIELLGDREV